MSAGAHPTLPGWLIRDGLITAGLGLLLWALYRWHATTDATSAAAAGAIVGFVAAYTLCYVYHEWGHLLGARLAHADMPLNRYAGALIGRFDVTAHSTGQFLAMSWGGVAGYVLVMVLLLAGYTLRGWGWVGAGLAVGAGAFVSQSLAVDLPQIWQVTRGADPLEINRRGASPAVILRRTWQAWLALAGALAVWNLLGG
jgi:hypothetical protein